MLKDPEINAVAIATPPSFRFPIAKAALIAGKNVLVDSLTTFSQSELKDLLSISRHLCLVLAGGQTGAHSGELQKIIDAITKRPIGELRTVALRHLTIEEHHQNATNPLNLVV